MAFDFGSIRAGFRRQLEIRQLRAMLTLLRALQAITSKLSSQAQQKKFEAEQRAIDQQTRAQYRSVHRQALFSIVGLALSQWSGMEDLLVGIASLLLRTHEAEKVGTIMYSTSFSPWLGIIEDLFSQEPRYISLKPKWNKLSGRLRGLKETRDRLAHHTIFDGEKASGDSSLRPSRFDIRQKVQKYQPLDYDEIAKFSDALGKITEDLKALLNSMTAILVSETSPQNSVEPNSDQRQP